MRALRPAVAALFLAVLALPAFADVHRDEDLGWAMQVPRGWKRIPLPSEERWVVAKYLCDRKYPTKDGWDHVPELKVIFFPAGRDLKQKDIKKTEKVGDDVTVTTTERNYRDFKDYLKENNSGSGFYISREEETTVNGIPATWIEIKWEKLTTPRRALAVVFHRDAGADYAVTCEVVEEQWDKLGRDIANLVRTFKFIEAKKDLRGESATATGDKPGADGKSGDPKDGDASGGDTPGGPGAPGAPGSEGAPGGGSTPEQVRKRFEEIRRKERERALKKELDHSRSTLPKGWREVKSKNFVCFTHADAKYTQRALDQAEAMRVWVEKCFTGLGSGEASQLIIRICETSDEESSFHGTSSGGFRIFLGGGDITYTTNQESMGRDMYALSSMNDWVLRNWFRDRDEDLYWSLPHWADRGLDGYVANGVLTKGRFMFRPDAGEITAIRKAVKNGNLQSFRTLLLSDSGDIEKMMKGDQNSISTFMEGYMQCRALVRYLLDGPGASDKRTRGCLVTLLNTCGEIRREKEQARAGGAGAPGQGEEKKPQTEEEEEQMSKKRQEEWKKEEKAYLEEVAKRTFKNLTDADWGAIDRQWKAFAAQYE